MAASMQATLDALLAATDSAVVGSYSAVLYGSAARGQYIEGHSDLNVLLVLDRVTPEVLRALGSGLGAWRKAGHPPPVLFTRSEWERAVDVFPLEVQDMKGAYRVLRGRDPLAGVTVPLASLRAALEREIRGLVQRLRRGYALEHQNPAGLGALARSNVASTLLLLRALLTLAREEIPNDPLALVTNASRVARFEPGAIAEAAERRADRKWRCPGPVFLEYLAAVEAAARYVDELEPGERR
jgi:hypothetical protein